jgi:hypothetical protein
MRLRPFLAFERCHKSIIFNILIINMLPPPRDILDRKLRNYLSLRAL